MIQLDSQAQQAANIAIPANSIWLVVLGAVLAVFGGLIASYVQHFFTERRIRSNVQFLVRQLLHDYDGIAQGIAEGFARSGMLLIELLNEGSSLMLLYDRNQEWVLLQSGIRDSRDVWRWFSRARKAINRALGVEDLILNRADSPPLVEWATNQRPGLAAEIAALRAEAATLLVKIER